MGFLSSDLIKMDSSSSSTTTSTSTSSSCTTSSLGFLQRLVKTAKFVSTRIRYYCDSNSDSLERSQHKRFSKTIVIPQSIPNQSRSQNQNQNQNSSKYKGVTLRESGKWGAQIRDLIRRRRVSLGVFPSEEEAHQAYQAAYDRIEKEKAQIAQGKKTQLYQKGEERREGAAAIQIKKEEEKAEKEVTTAVVSPPVKKRKRTISRHPVQPQSFVSKEKQRNDIPSDNPTSGADSRTGPTSPVHNTSARPPGFLEDLSSQLLKQEALTDADLKTGDFDSENDLIQVDHLSTWTGNLNWDENLLFKK